MVNRGSLDTFALDPEGVAKMGQVIKGILKFEHVVQYLVKSRLLKKKTFQCNHFCITSSSLCPNVGGVEKQEQESRAIMDLHVITVLPMGPSRR